MVLSSGRVNSTNLVRQSFANVYNLINTRSNVADPADSTGARKFVYVRMPNLGRAFQGFPFVVVNRVMPMKRKGTTSLTKSIVDYNFTIMIYTQDSSSDSLGNPSGADQADTITDAVRETLDSASNRKTLITQGMSQIEYEVDSDVDELDGRTVFVTEFDVNFVNNLIQTG
jgi:hypothetical protein|tara:strand:- start:10 stop:522 length:513 start_codon:yes stop_codon:yes gene_type:complete